ncbi:MAG TPA: hypothetical protein VMZ53_18520 [Kofleriaceae bacterium]|nr:hypothetical protein [Kofleriaceae bacterium]
MRTMLALMVVAACGKSSSPPENKETKATGSAPVGSAAAGSGSSAAEPVEAATVSGPTKSATGTITVGGAITGSFQWVKKDQRAPITCVWDPDKEIGTLKIDLSDGAGHVVTLGLDVPPTDVGPGRLEVISKELPSSLKTYRSFTMKPGDDADHFSVVFAGTVAVSDPDAQTAEKPDKKKKAEPPPDPHVTLEGTLEMTCPKKK